MLLKYLPQQEGKSLGKNKGVKQNLQVGRVFTAYKRFPLMLDLFIYLPMCLLHFPTCTIQKLDHTKHKETRYIGKISHRGDKQRNGSGKDSVKNVFSFHPQSAQEKSLVIIHLSI